MTATIVFLVFIGLIVLGLQRNHARQRYHPASLGGGGTATDRDAERVAVDLAAARQVTFAAARGADQRSPGSTAGTNRAPCAATAAHRHFAR